MRGETVKTVKNIIKLIVVPVLILSLFGCQKPHKEQKKEEPQVLDGPDMAYVDSDYRSEYANVLGFDSYEGQPYFAVAFLGYGDRMEFRHTYVEGIFSSLGDFAIEQVGHIDYEGDEWYLIVPRYKEEVNITNLDTGDVHTVYNGEAFTVKCNLSDIHPNIEISTEQGYSGHKFSPQIGGDGKLVSNADVHDITDYSVTTSYVQGE